MREKGKQPRHLFSSSLFLFLFLFFSFSLLLFGEDRTVGTWNPSTKPSRLSWISWIQNRKASGKPGHSRHFPPTKASETEPDSDIFRDRNKSDQSHHLMPETSISFWLFGVPGGNQKKKSVWCLFVQKHPMVVGVAKQMPRVLVARPPTAKHENCPFATRI